MRYLPYLACVSAAVVAAGCASTDRILQTAGSDVVLDTPRQIQPPDAVFSCFSPDGRLYAVIVPDGEKLTFEVRQTDGDKTLYRQGPDHLAEALPVLFLNNGRELACLGEVDGALEVLDWEHRTWRRLQAPPGMTVGDVAFSLSLVPLTNASATMTYLGSCVLTSEGVVTPVRNPRATSGWDPNGRFLVQEEGAWTMIDGHGRESRVQTPVHIDPCPLLSKGTMRVYEKSENLKRNGSDVFASALWLDPAPGSARSDARTPDSALVFLGYDVKAYGFVPGRDAVFVNSGGGSFIVPFRTRSSPDRGGPAIERPEE
ncbi:MAG: hypothetical protein JST30_05310 [Armatimonadetes bacterium]|nr:hypothetical protein [Armatimonadota bacterium]